MSHLILLRHGQSVWNKKGLFTGWVDVPLSKKGIEEANGYARIVDHESNSKLEVSFFSILGWRPVWGDYWIIDLAEDYSWVIVGEPGRKYAWILARTQTLEPNLQQQLEQRLADQGYDISSLQRLPHAAAPDTR